MGLIFSRQCEYALQALLYLALKPSGQMTSIKELTKRLNIPYHFLAKILQDLAHRGLLNSLKGPTGGFALAVPPQDITLFHVVEAVDGIGFTNSCVMGFKECSVKNPCAVHEKWAGIRESVYDMLVNKNLAQMAHEIKKAEYQPPFA